MIDRRDVLKSVGVAFASVVFGNKMLPTCNDESSELYCAYKGTMILCACYSKRGVAWIIYDVAPFVLNGQPISNIKLIESNVGSNLDGSQFIRDKEQDNWLRIPINEDGVYEVPGT